MTYEVELKFRVRSVAELEQTLKALGATPVSSHEEIDLYLRHPARSFAETDEALRVRQIGCRLFVTYKGPKVDRTTKTRVEIELEFAPGSDRADLLRFWSALSFQPVREVRKQRQVLHVPWQEQIVHACLDRVAGVGEFLELEISASAEDLDQSRQLLKSLADRLNLHETERRSYLELLIEADGAAG